MMEMSKSKLGVGLPDMLAMMDSLAFIFKDDQFKML
jgi:hypothetical protein